MNIEMCDRLEDALRKYLDVIIKDESVRFPYMAGIYRAIIEMMPETKENEDHLEGFISRWEEEVNNKEKLNALV